MRQADDAKKRREEKSKAEEEDEDYMGSFDKNLGKNLLRGTTGKFGSRQGRLVVKRRHDTYLNRCSDVMETIRKVEIGMMMHLEYTGPHHELSILLDDSLSFVPCVH
jgi:hypothetical protein